MSNIRTCIACEDEFNLTSPAKIKAGGFSNTCPDCSEENTIKYAGVQSSDGKGSQVNVLSFNSDEDRAKYISFWKNNSGHNKGKSCQLGSHLSTDRGIKFETVVTHVPTNHKGKS